LLSNAGSVYIDDIRLVAGAEPGVGPILILNGDFESELSGPWTLSDNYVNSAVSSEVKLVGEASLNLVANGFPSSGRIMTQDLPILESNVTHTISYWYLSNTNNLTLTVRLSDNTIVATTNIRE